MSTIYTLTLRQITHYGYVNADNRTILKQTFGYTENMILYSIRKVRDRIQWWVVVNSVMCFETLERRIIFSGYATVSFLQKDTSEQAMAVNVNGSCCAQRQALANLF
jgi:hypothetical protein